MKKDATTYDQPLRLETQGMVNDPLTKGKQPVPDAAGETSSSILQDPLVRSPSQKVSERTSITTLEPLLHDLYMEENFKQVLG